MAQEDRERALGLCPKPAVPKLRGQLSSYLMPRCADSRSPGWQGMKVCRLFPVKDNYYPELSNPFQ